MGIPSDAGIIICILKSFYRISLTAAILMATAVTANGTALPGSTFTAAVAVNSYSSLFIANLKAGQNIQLLLSGLVGTAILQSGTGVTLTITRLS